MVRAATASAAASSAPSAPEPAANGSPLPGACGKPWNLDVIGGDARVVVVCSNDVQRRALDESGAIGQSLAPGLDPAREKVCGCLAHLRAPPFVDLVFTAEPTEGRVTVEARGDDDIDPELGPPFVSCVGTVSARFSPLSAHECPGAGKVAFIYPVRLELAP